MFQKLPRKTVEDCLQKVLQALLSQEQDLFALTCIAGIADDFSVEYKKQIIKKLQDSLDHDDLGCMACAQGSYFLLSVDSTNGKNLAHVTKRLIAAEAAPGGPYYGEQGVDPGLNAAIAWMLSVQGIQLPGLQHYIEQCIAHKEYESTYYSNPYVVQYLFSRCKISDSASTELAAQIEMQDLAIFEYKNVEQITYALGILLRCNPESPTIEKLLGAVCEKIQGSSQSSISALTAEVLHMYLHRKNVDTEALHYRAQLHEYIEGFIVRQPGYLARQISELLPMIIAKDTHGEICMMAYECSKLLPTHQRLAVNDLARIGFASLLGWAGYWVYDQVMDEQKHVALLPAAHVCIREVQTIYAQFGFEEHAAAIMNRMENANAVEFGKRAHVEALDNALLVDRSMGHALAVLVQIYRAGYTTDSTEYQAVEGWFRNYILAKQLHDDAHDWEDDLLRGTNTQPVQLVLARAQTLGYSLEDNRDEIIQASRNYFLSHCMEIIASQILMHLRHAECAIHNTPTLSAEPLMKYIIPLRNGANRAVRQSQEMNSFLHAMDLQSVLS